MIVEELLPIRKMEISHWDSIFSGFVMTGEHDIAIPRANVFSDQIIGYLLNTELNILDYTNQYDKFYFHIASYAKFSSNVYPEGISVLDQYGTIVLELSVLIDGQQFAKVNKHEALQMIAQWMLASVPKYLFHRADFDGQKFYDDILPILKPIADGTRTFQEEEFPL